jgi:hypothetical protein
MNATTALLLLKLLDVTIAALAAYPLSQAKFKSMHGMLQKAVDEGRDMTDAEMVEIFTEAEDLHNRIQGA